MKLKIDAQGSRRKSWVAKVGRCDCMVRVKVRTSSARDLWAARGPLITGKSPCRSRRVDVDQRMLKRIQLRHIDAEQLSKPQRCKKPDIFFGDAQFSRTDWPIRIKRCGGQTTHHGWVIRPLRAIEPTTFPPPTNAASLAPFASRLASTRNGS